MGNGMNKILPGLYIGNFKDARDMEQLSKNKVTHILSVHDSARPMLEGVKYLCIPAADSPSQNLTRHFKESIKFIHECRLQGEGCLVHWSLVNSHVQGFSLQGDVFLKTLLGFLIKSPDEEPILQVRFLFIIIIIRIHLSYGCIYLKIRLLEK
ncbi:dual specificity protein phosphatase 22 isoform X4 [Dipodomys merriami]|uniref:dual specificity protein phosphatase 22 isoform X4 n=1 Tax=Dipodomys merriami TaxID=94247 RepID=UPI0038557F9C